MPEVYAQQKRQNRFGGRQEGESFRTAMKCSVLCWGDEEMAAFCRVEMTAESGYVKRADRDDQVLLYLDPLLRS